MENNIFYGWNENDIKLQADELDIELNADQITQILKEVVDDFGEDEELNEWANRLIQEAIQRVVQSEELELIKDWSE